MEIEDQRKKKRKVSDLDIGDCFFYDDGNLYMKVGFGLFKGNASEDYPNTVVCLNNNNLDGFGNSTYVTAVTAKVIIQN